jgi:hypothetical protein
MSGMPRIRRIRTHWNSSSHYNALSDVFEILTTVLKDLSKYSVRIIKKTVSYSRTMPKPRMPEQKMRVTSPAPEINMPKNMLGTGETYVRCRRINMSGAERKCLKHCRRRRYICPPPEINMPKKCSAPEIHMSGAAR